MSYDQLSNLESGRPGGYSDNPDFQNHLFDLKKKYDALIKSNRTLTSDVGQLGTKKDSPRLRERVHNSMNKARDLCQEIGDGIKKLQTWEDLTKQQKYEQTKVSSDFQAALQDFQSLQRTALDKQKASVSAARAAYSADPSQPAAYADGQQQEQLQQQLPQLADQDEVDFQEALIIEREDEIRNIEQGVGDLNVLFRQVAHIVNEQGQQLDTIENNVENVRDDTRQADVENRQAARYQKAARNKGCCLLLIMGVILTIVLLAIFID